MSTRRQFLRVSASAAAGIVFAGCSCPGVASAQSLGATRPVTINGKRVKTIDVHAHCFFREATALIGEDARRLTPSTIRGSDAAYLTIEERLKSMDAQAVDVEVLSINPFWYERERDLAAEIVAIQNEKLAELVAAHAERFAAFASLTLQDPALAVRQLETAVKKQGLRGAAIGASVGTASFSDAKFHPIWAKAEELGAVLFIHPRGVPELAERFKGNGWLANTIGNPLETTIALEHLIFAGTLDRFPGLKVIAAHGGGYLPAYAARSDHACYVGEGLCDKDIALAKRPSEYLKQLHFDSLVFTAEELRHLVAEVGASQVMLGSDNPYPWQGHPVDHVLATATLSDEEKIAILGGNAARLLGLNA
ncbi:MAG TPA: amidohydrolase family protein [Stellaceae bacterium]|nr:amidohydrolase family protein [Stellaceae bacterium]